MQPQPQRTFIASDGHTYTARLTPYERTGGRGVHPDLFAITFETANRWVGAVPVPGAMHLDRLSSSQLEDLLVHARGRG